MEADNITDHDMLSTIIPMTQNEQTSQSAGKPHKRDSDQEDSTAGPQAE
jgi:hypothetical protein